MKNNDTWIITDIQKIMIEKKNIVKKEKASLNASKTENEIKVLQDSKNDINKWKQEIVNIFVKIRYCIKLQQGFKNNGHDI